MIIFAFELSLLKKSVNVSCSSDIVIPLNISLLSIFTNFLGMFAIISYLLFIIYFSYSPLSKGKPELVLHYFEHNSQSIKIIIIPTLLLCRHDVSESVRLGRDARRPDGNGSAPQEGRGQHHRGALQSRQPGQSADQH